MKPLTFIGVPIDSVGRDGGAEHGPEVLRELGLPAALGGEDAGDLPLRIRGEERDPATGLLGSDDVLASTRAIRAAVAERLGQGERPFLGGGCCAELPGALAGARDALGEPVGLVHLDGHQDLYDGATSTTGEAADMPISVVLGLGPEAWVEAAGGASADPRRTALVGFRDQEEARQDGMRHPGAAAAPRLRRRAPRPRPCRVGGDDRRGGRRGRPLLAPLRRRRPRPVLLPRHRLPARRRHGLGRAAGDAPPAAQLEAADRRLARLLQPRQGPAPRLRHRPGRGAGGELARLGGSSETHVRGWRAPDQAAQGRREAE
ncbi:MAG TPA: arginase family protein [Solirubrobacterales bacterium]